jgi:hypothetical protein
MPKLLRAYRKRLQKEGRERIEARAKQEKIIREVQDHFGYDINRSDDLYKEYRLEKAEEEKKARKSQSREDKAAKSEVRLKAAKARLRKQLADETAKKEAEESGKTQVVSEDSAKDGEAVGDVHNDEENVTNQKSS